MQRESIEIFRAASDNEEGKIVADRIVELSLQQQIQKIDLRFYIAPTPSLGLLKNH